jgi:hypothetical protein
MYVLLEELQMFVLCRICSRVRLCIEQENLVIVMKVYSLRKCIYLKPVLGEFDFNGCKWYLQ